jgi:hypothetical protein
LRTARNTRRRSRKAKRSLRNRKRGGAANLSRSDIECGIATLTAYMTSPDIEVDGASCEMLKQIIQANSEGTEADRYNSIIRKGGFPVRQPREVETTPLFVIGRYVFRLSSKLVHNRTVDPAPPAPIYDEYTRTTRLEMRLRTAADKSTVRSLSAGTSDYNVRSVMPPQSGPSPAISVDVANNDKYVSFYQIQKLEKHDAPWANTISAY